MAKIALGKEKSTVTTNHGCDTKGVSDQCSTDVFVGDDKKGVVRVGDRMKDHLVSGTTNNPCTLKHGKGLEPALSKGSETVIVNNKGVGRVGDKYGSEEISTTDHGSYPVEAGG